MVIYGENKGNDYDLWWDDIKTDMRPDDYYEMNNNLIFAYDLTSHKSIPLTTINGSGLQYDEDWYEIYVDETELQLVVKLRFDSAEGDIWQHMVNNDDWTIEFLLCTYLDLLKCDDEIFLKFVETCVHPIILTDKNQVSVTVSEFNKYLKSDYYHV